VLKNQTIIQTLQTTFGFDEFLPGQAEVIERVVAGDSTLVVFPTGQGKSLCYQLPALHLSGLTLVVSPLMALMKDQVDFLVAKGVAAARLDSSLDFAQIKEINERLRAGSLKILYVAPERFANERFVNLIKGINISLMVVDEAHCISEWGHNFRPDYLKLAELSRKFQVPTVLALTATATPKVADDIRAAFAVSEQNYIKTGFYRPNLTLRFTPSSDPFATLIKRLAAQPQAPTIVYVTLQKTAEQVAKKLSDQGYTAMAYHAGLKDEKRRQIQEWFMAANDGVVVATIAFGMGIDKANIRYVYHYNLPKSLENYAQEIGRAGRDGEPSICEVLGGSQDLISLENFVYGDTPEVQAVHDLVAFILAQDKIFDVGVYELSGKFDIRPLVVKTLLTYLELDGFIAATGPFYGGYKFKPLRSSQEIFKQFDPERVAFLTSLFSCAEKAKIWFTIDLQQAIQKTGQSRQRIIAALDYLAEQGDLDLQVSNSRLGYQKLIEVSREQLEKIQADICRRFDRREEMDLKRLQTVVALVNEQSCKTAYLLNYFGEQLPTECGHCEHCLTGGSPLLNRQDSEPIELEDNMAAVRELMTEYPEALGTPRQACRFLCGLTSPRLTRAKLSKHELFGSFSHVSFGLVHKWLQSGK